MKVTPTELPEVLLIEPQVHGDSRGFFYESFQADAVRRRWHPGHLRPGQPLALRAGHPPRPPLPGAEGAGKAGPGAPGNGVRRGGGRPARLAALRSLGRRSSSPRGRPASCGSRRGSRTASACSATRRTSSTSAPSSTSPRPSASIAWNDPAIGIRWPVAEPLLSRRTGPRRRSRTPPRCCPPSPADVRELLSDWLLSPAYAFRRAFLPRHGSYRLIRDEEGFFRLSPDAGRLPHGRVLLRPSGWPRWDALELEGSVRVSGSSVHWSRWLDPPAAGEAMEIELPYGLRDLAARLLPDPRGVGELALGLDELGTVWVTRAALADGYRVVLRELLHPTEGDGPARSRLGAMAWTLREGIDTAGYARWLRTFETPSVPALERVRARAMSSGLRVSVVTAPRTDGPENRVPAAGEGGPRPVLQGGRRRHPRSAGPGAPPRATRAPDAALRLPGTAGGHAGPRRPRSPRGSRPGPSRLQAGARLRAASQPERPPGATRRSSLRPPGSGRPDARRRGPLRVGARLHRRTPAGEGPAPAGGPRDPRSGPGGG